MDGMAGEQVTGVIGPDDPLLALLCGDDGSEPPSATADSVSRIAEPPHAAADVVVTAVETSLLVACPVPSSENASCVATTVQPRPAFSRAATQTLDLNMEDGSPAVTDDEGDLPTSTLCPSASPCLVSTNATTAPDIALDASSIAVGRHDTCTVALTDLRVSGEQFLVKRRKALTDASGDKTNQESSWVYDFQDCSRNGTLVNKKLIKEGVVQLRDHDLIEVLPAAAVGRSQAIAFLFLEPTPATASSCSASSAASVEEPPTKRQKTANQATGESPCENVLDFAICVICQEVIHRATSIQPCLHSFCSMCLGVWLKRPSKWGRTCPVCRKEVSGVSRQHQMDGLIQGLLQSHPSQSRSPKDLEALDAQDPLLACGYDISRLSGSSSSSVAAAPFMAAVPGVVGAVPAAPESTSDSEEGSDSDASDTPAPGAFSMQSAAVPPCFHCGGVSRGTLGDAAHHLAASAPARVNADVMRDALSGNDFERGVLQEWLAARGRGLGAALLDILAVPNPTGSSAVRLRFSRAAASSSSAFPATTGSAAPSALMPDGDWTGMQACRGCSMEVLKALVYSIRERIPVGELATRAQGRADCWYGRSCRTQTHRPEHAARLNHICEQTRF